MKKAAAVIMAGVLFSAMLLGKYAFPEVLKEGEKTYIVDRLGEKWDVTQAMTLGFKPEKFQYGLGKNAIEPLDRRSLSDSTGNVLPELRVIGVEDENEAQAYSVPKLRRHEVANTDLSNKPIAVAY